jgi:hypothetical protein
MKAKLIFDGKEFEVELTEEEAKKFEQKTKRTGYERVQNAYDNFSAVTAEGIVKSDYFDDTGVGYFAERCYESANYYSSYEVAENNARADKLMRRLRRFAVEHRELDMPWGCCSRNDYAYYIYYDYVNEEIMWMDRLYDCKDLGIVYFDTVNVCELAIDTFRDELIWYFTEYKDSL